jgi:cytochrome o ubiquinol oxidase operon protein cyoD
MVTFKSYFTGFILSIGLTLAAYFAVTNHSVYAMVIIFLLAAVQFFVQLLFFLDLGSGRSAGWNWLFLGFALSVIGILVGGSLWIMNNLNYNMTPSQMNASMLDQAE